MPSSVTHETSRYAINADAISMPRPVSVFSTSGKPRYSKYMLHMRVGTSTITLKNALGYRCTMLPIASGTADERHERQAVRERRVGAVSARHPVRHERGAQQADNEQHEVGRPRLRARCRVRATTARRRAASRTASCRRRRKAAGIARATTRRRRTRACRTADRPRWPRTPSAGAIARCRDAAWPLPSAYRMMPSLRSCAVTALAMPSMTAKRSCFSNAVDSTPQSCAWLSTR